MDSSVEPTPTIKQEIKLLPTSLFDKICRCCLSLDTEETSYMFEVTYENVNLWQIFKNCAAVQVEEDDRLPISVCKCCVEALENIYTFQQQCQRSDDILRAVFKEQYEILSIDQEELTSTSIIKPDIIKLEDEDISSNSKGVPPSRPLSNKKYKYKSRIQKGSDIKHEETQDQTIQDDDNIGTHKEELPETPMTCFVQATTLQNHKKTHAKYNRIGGDANSPHFVCNYCGRQFKRLARYNAHLKTHSSDGGDVKEPVQDDEPREHICIICKRAYKTKHRLKAHQLTHGEKTFLCSECSKGFVTKAALQSHLKVHTGEKPHTCNVCKKSFAHVASFEAHILIHTGQKPYNCNICAKAFTQKTHLKYHLRTHSGERPYVCSFCGKSFALKNNLTVHVRTHTGETPYICPICGKGFYDSSSMKKHKRRHVESGMPPPSQTRGVNVIGGVNGVDVINSINCVTLNPMIS